ncbi:MAG: hypothetical protein HY549_02860, partial [Elusimicrobia bacterium]|nr:hypothetical protein [Elusimicrobiota bacterium]
MSRPTLIYYVSGHGWGHASRAAALLGALRRAEPSLRLVVRSSAPERIFKLAVPGVELEPSDIDPGMAQLSALDIDFARSLEIHERIVLHWDETVKREAEHLRELGADLALGDIPPLAFAAASRAGIGSIAVSNFSWDWIFSGYEKSEPRWASIASVYGEAYSRAGLLLRLPMATEMPEFRRVIDSPLLAPRPSGDPEALRRELGLAAGDR